MAKLYFRHGAVSSAKTLNLLAVAHTYRQQGKKVILIKPELDIRFGVNHIKSRAGLGIEADILVKPETNLLELDLEGVSCLLVDEAQFLSATQIEQLRQLTDIARVPIICYGLRTDFRTYAFEGSKRLLELADAIEEVKTTCFFCNKKAVFNLKHVNGIPSLSGPAVDLGAEEKYYPVCFHCYASEIKKNNKAVFGESIKMAQVAPKEACCLSKAAK